MLLLQQELDKLKRQSDAKMHDIELEMKTKQDKLSKELENKWSDTLKRETMRLRHEIAQQKDEERKHALAQLSKMKDEESAAMKRSWEKKVEDLLAEVGTYVHNMFFTDFRWWGPGSITLQTHAFIFTDLGYFFQGFAFQSAAPVPNRSSGGGTGASATRSAGAD